MKDECLICGALLTYLDKDVPVKCAICGREESSKTLCEKGHYVCDACHTAGADAIIGLCLGETSTDPIAIVRKLMDMDSCHMHGPEHHIMVGSALLTAYKNAGSDIDLEKSLLEMQSRGSKVPGGACGFWGACGAGVSAGMFISIATGSTPLKNREWALSNAMTSAALAAIAAHGGPRCCKRNSYTAILAAVAFAKEHLGVEMQPSAVKCTHSHLNNQCIEARCPFR
ncbi:MAG: SAM-dependent methyltransferase [Oscillospiraceae bacterium]|nr:SAM-dependent methyltransferase [Oscillospiraceae bacterium]